MALDAAGSFYPLYTKSFTVHRLAPLFHNDTTLDNTTLRLYASQFRDILTGEVLRGVQIGLAAEDDVIARVGALRSVQWSLLKKEEDWQSAPDEVEAAGDAEEAGDAEGAGDAAINQETENIGILVEINYENLSYSAILLKDVGEARQDDVAGFSHYPLLLTRMPASLRETLIGFLASTFDTRASVLKLPSSFLIETAEKYFANLTTGDNGPLESDEATQVLRTIVKDILITISFDAPGVHPLIKTVEFTISKEDSWGMIASGRKLLQSEGGNQNNNAEVRNPFTRALKHYLDTHMGLKLDNGHVHISRVACAAFVIGIEGKVKHSAPAVGDTEDMQRNATKELVNRLVELAKGGKTLTMINLS